MITEPESERVDPLLRNGNLSAITITLVFSLGFATQWGSNPVGWEADDLPAVAALGLGILLQFGALASLLPQGSLDPARFRRAVRAHVGGMVAMLLGIVVGIGGDAPWLDRSQPPSEQRRSLP
jgi:hypothetical protein